MPRRQRNAHAVELALLGGRGVVPGSPPGSESAEVVQSGKERPQPEPEPEPDLEPRPAMYAQTQHRTLTHEEMLAHAQLERDHIRAVLAQTQADAARMLKEQKDRHARAMAEHQAETAEELASLDNARAAAEAQVRMAAQTQALLNRLEEQPTTRRPAWTLPTTAQELVGGEATMDEESDGEELYSESDPELELELEPESEHSGVYAKLTDVNLFTGSHKHRFDPQTGIGLGSLHPGTEIDLDQVEKHHEYVELLKETRHQQRIADLQDRADRMQQWALDKRWREEEQMVELFERHRAREQRAIRAQERRDAAAQREAAEKAALHELQEHYSMTDSDQWAPPVSGRRKIAEGVPRARKFSTQMTRTGSRSPRSSSASPRTQRGERRAPASVFDRLTDDRMYTAAHKARLNASSRVTVDRSDSPTVVFGVTMRSPPKPSEPDARQHRSRTGEGGKLGKRNGMRKFNMSSNNEPPPLSPVSADGTRDNMNETISPLSDRASVAAASTDAERPTQQVVGAGDEEEQEEEEEEEEEDSSDGEDPVEFLIARRARSAEPAIASSLSRALHNDETAAVSYQDAHLVADEQE